MKKNLLTTTLMTVALCMGMSAFAQTTVPVKMTYVDGGNVDAAAGEVTEATVGFLKIAGNELTTANAGWGVNNIVYLQVDASGVEGTVTSATLDATFSDNTGNKRGTVAGVGYNASEWSSTLTWATADRTITTCGPAADLGRGPAVGAHTFDITEAFKNDDDKIVTILVYATNAAGVNLTAVPTVTVTAADASLVATYTKKYVDEEGNELKDAVVITTEKDTDVAVADEDKADINKDGQKYIYANDNAKGMTVAADGSTVVVVTFRKAQTWTATLTNTLDDNTVSTSGFEGDYVSLPYPRYLLSEHTLYEAGKLGDNGRAYYASVLLSEDNISQEVEYTAKDITNVVFLAEGENVEGAGVFNTGNSFARSSNAACGYFEEDTKLCTLAPGKYIISGEVFSAAAATTIEFTIGETVVLSAEGPKNSNVTAFASEELVVEAEADLTVKGGSASGAGLDFVYIQKVDLPTAISAVAANKSEAVYNLAGQRVNKAAKGIYIINGNKIVVK